MIEFVLGIQEPTRDNLLLARRVISFIERRELTLGEFYNRRLFEKSWKLSEVAIAVKAKSDPRGMCPGYLAFTPLMSPLEHGLGLFQEHQRTDAMTEALALVKSAFQNGKLLVLKCLSQEFRREDRRFELFKRFLNAAEAAKAPQDSLESLAAIMLYGSIQAARSAEVPYANGGGFHNAEERINPALSDTSQFLRWLDERPKESRSSVTASTTNDVLKTMISLFDSLKIDSLGRRSMKTESFNTTPLKAFGIGGDSPGGLPDIQDIYSKAAAKIGTQFQPASEIWNDLGQTYYKDSWY
jgi:hypothetical protein